MARIVAISNQKGGVGKTTTAINLSASLAAAGQTVLLVDLDPQGNASSGLGHPRANVSAGIYDVLLGFRDLDSVRLPTYNPSLELLPATRDLVGAEVELVDEPNRERLLKRALDSVRDDFDWILIDCAPSLGLLTVNALTAADSVLVPLQAEYYAMEGLGELLRTVAAVKKGLNPDLQREGILLTMVDTRNRLCNDVEHQTREVFGQHVFQTTIPRNVRLGEAPSHGLPAREYARTSTGARAYEALALELTARRTGMALALEAM